MSTASTAISSSSGQKICRFYNTKNGCRAGDACPYSHTRSPVSGTQPRHYQASLVDPSKVVPKPKPQIEDARAFQLGQIKRRYSPEHTETEDADTFTFNLKPSDPDFPYDLETLTCAMSVPKTYPDELLVLRVLNKEIPRGFQINIERGFRTICSENPTATLLGIMNRLDRQLEAILSGEMAETIKIVAHRPRQTPAKPSTPSVLRPAPTTGPAPTRYTPEEKSNAQTRRQTDIRQLEARFGRLPAFQKSNDGLRYTLPLDSPRKSTWPAPLQNIRILMLIVPELYPLEAASLVLDSDSDEARNVEATFTKRSIVEPSSTLTQMINYLTVNLKAMSQADVTMGDQMTRSTIPQQAPTVPLATTSNDTAKQDPDKPHVHIIPRPPEWDVHESEDSEFESDSFSSAEETEESVEEQVYSSAPIERGILISFPNLELHGIELMEVSSLGITVKCDRCKDTMDIDRLRSITPEATAPRSESCKKCANGLAITFRADLIHSNCVRAGYLDLDGCTIVDMLPSTFTPTCAECSVQHPALVSVRGENTMAVCRECHKKMTFRLPEVKFLQISAVNIRASQISRKPKEKLGVVAGTELPRRGRCTHYAKSYRWFRFSCCNKVFPCDRCHDAAEEHANEHANRMLCGYCSREQNYRPEDCGICHAVLIGKQGRGFWEGGKGTRDKARMSRKDPRKYKRIGSAKK